MTDWQKQLSSPVAVLLGGTSAERDISMQSGAAVLNALHRLNIPAQAIDTREPGWLAQVVGHFDHSFIALHGLGGEDGTVQGAMELAGISYTGSGVLASALAMDKLRCKQLWRGIDLPTPPFAILDEKTDWEELLQMWQAAMVKPAHEGSSIGMAKVESAGAFEQAYVDARRYDATVLAEAWVEGAEFTVAVLGDRALPAIRLETDRAFYDYNAKYASSDTHYICPCGLEPEAEQQLCQLALRAFHSLGCRGWGRVDFMQDSGGSFYVLEVNTVPGLTDHSLVPMAAKAEGMTFDQLVAEILRLSLQETNGE